MSSKLALVLVLVLGISAVLFFGCISTSSPGPQPPSNLALSALANGVKVTWSPSPSPDVSGYNIYRSNAKNQLGGKLNGGLVNDVSFTDSNVQDGNTYYYIVRAVNSKGVEEQNMAQMGIAVQNAPPSGLTISINGGMEVTSTKSVSLTLSAQKASECQFSNDGSTWSGYEAYTTQKAWTLQGDDGPKTVYYECKNSLGLTSAPVNSPIYLKTLGAQIVISSPADGDTIPTQFNLTFVVSNSYGPTTCSAQVDDSTVPIGAVTEGQPKTVPLALGESGHSLIIQCADKVSNFSSPLIHFQTEAHPLSLEINDGSGETSKTSVMLDVYSTSASQCRFSNDGVMFGSWQAYRKITPWNLTSGNGQKTVYANCKTSAGADLGTVSDKTLLQIVPSVMLSINNDESVTTSRSVRLSVYAPTAVDCRFGNDQNSYSSWQQFQSTLWYTLPGGDGSKTVYCQCRDSTGVVGTTYSTIRLRTQPSNPPSGLSIMINGGASRTSSTSVTLSLSADNADTCRYMNDVDGGSWTGWSGYTRTRSWDLSGGPGLKTVYYQCQNSNGISSTASASIQYGSTQPTINVVNPVDGQTYSDTTVSIVFTPRGSSDLDCVYYCNGVSRSIGTVSSGSRVSRTLVYTGMDMHTECGVPDPGSRFTTRVMCSDRDGNSADTGIITYIWTQWVGPLV